MRKSVYIDKDVKICSDCKVARFIEEYPKNKAKKDGFSNVCKICGNLRHKIYRKNNKEKEILRRRQRYLNNKQKELNASQIYKTNKILKDKSFKLIRNLRIRHSQAVKAAGNCKTFQTTKLLGCTASELKEHFQTQFTHDMNWDNYGIIWQIDHKFPLSLVDWNNNEQIAKYCHYSNLQPMLCIDNIRKGNRITTI